MDIFIVAKWQYQFIIHGPWDLSTWSLEDLKNSLTLAESAVTINNICINIWISLSLVK